MERADEPGRAHAFWCLLRTRAGFRRLFLCNVVSLLGDWLSYIAVSLVALNQGEGALAIALVFVAHTLPTALVAPVSGPLADRFNRKTLLLISYGLASILTLGMMAAAEAGLVLILQACLLIRGCVSGLGITARTASVPMLVNPRELHDANALLGLTWSVMFTTGVALGGFVTAYLSPVGAIALDALTFIIAAIIALGLPQLPPPASHEKPKLGINELIQTWGDLQKIAGARYSLLAKTPFAIANAGGWIALNLLAAKSLPTLSLGVALGVLQGVRAIGTGIGPLVPQRIFPQRSHVATPFVFAGVLIFAYTKTPWLALLGLLLWGMGSGHNFVSSTAELQKLAPGRILGRTVALDFSLLCSAQALTAIFCGLLADFTGDARDCAVTAVAVGFATWLLAKKSREPMPD